MNKSKKAKYLRETSRQETFKGFAYNMTLAAFIRKANKFPLQQKEIDNYIKENKALESS